MEEVVPVKIDFKKFKELFPDESSGWEIELRVSWPDRDLSGVDMAYAFAIDSMFSKLPKDIRKPLALFVSATSVHTVQCADFNDYEIECDYDPEEWMDAALPKLDPRKMKRIAKALDEFRKQDYQGAIREAWKNSDVESNEGVTDRLEAADDFIEYLEHWIAAFVEIHNDGAVLGVAISL